MLQQQESGGTLPITGNMTVVRDANYYSEVSFRAAKAGNWQLAIRCMQEMLKFDLTGYKKADVHKKMAWGYVELQKPFEAAKNFMLAAEFSISFDHEQACSMFIFAGNNYEKSENWAKAAECFEREARLNVDPAKKAISLLRAGNNYEKSENWAKAAECFEREARLNVDPAKKAIALARAGNNYEKCENWAKAAECFKTEMKFQLDPNKKLLCLTRTAACLARDGKEKQAFKCFEQAYKVAEGDPEGQRIVRETMLKYLTPLSLSTQIKRHRSTTFHLQSRPSGPI